MEPHKRLGEQGEKLAAYFLEKKGYVVLQKNYHAPGGEIDLIAQNSEGKFIFIEVKTRQSTAFGTAKEAVSRSKYQKILRAIEHFFLKQLSVTEIPEFQVDVLAIRKSGRKFFVEHVENIGFDDF